MPSTTSEQGKEVVVPVAQIAEQQHSFSNGFNWCCKLHEKISPHRRILPEVNCNVVLSAQIE